MAILPPVGWLIRQGGNTQVCLSGQRVGRWLSPPIYPRLNEIWSLLLLFGMALRRVDQHRAGAGPSTYFGVLRGEAQASIAPACALPPTLLPSLPQ